MKVTPSESSIIPEKCAMWSSLHPTRFSVLTELPTRNLKLGRHLFELRSTCLDAWRAVPGTVIKEGLLCPASDAGQMPTSPTAWLREQHLIRGWPASSFFTPLPLLRTVSPLPVAECSFPQITSAAAEELQLSPPLSRVTKKKKNLFCALFSCLD